MLDTLGSLAIFVLVIPAAWGVLAFLHEEALETEQVGAAAVSRLVERVLEGAGSPDAWRRNGSGDPVELGLAVAARPGVLDHGKVVRFQPYRADALQAPDVRRAWGLREGEQASLRVRLAATVDGDDAVPGLGSFRVAYVAAAGPVGVPAAEAAALRGLASYGDGDATAATFDPTGAADRFPEVGELGVHLPLRLWGFEAAEQPSATPGAFWRVVAWGSVGPGEARGEPALRVLTFSDGAPWGYEGGAEPRVILPRLDLQNVTPGAMVELELVHWVGGRVHRDPVNPEVVLLRDEGRVEVMGCRPGCTPGSWDALPAFGDTGTPLGLDGFVTQRVNLSAFVGQAAWVSLRWSSNVHLARGTPGVEEGSGWFVRSLRVVATEAGVERVLYQNRLDGRSRRVDALVVGSGVDHAHLNDPLVADALQLAVRNGTGLLALGTADLDASWLAPVILTDEPAGSEDPDGTVSVTDPGHGLLQVPHPVPSLGRTPLPAHETLTYPIGPGFLSLIEVLESSGVGPNAVLLGVGAPSTLLEGPTVLTSFTPGAWADREEGIRFLANALTHLAHHDHHVEFSTSRQPAVGPRATATTERTLVHPEHGPVRVRVELTLWTT